MNRKRRFQRPSAALMVSILALFVALGGVGAVASGVLTSKKVKKIAKKQVLALAPGLSVANAKKIDGASLGSLTVGRSAPAGCDLGANNSTFTNCGSVSLTLPRSGRVLLNFASSWRDGGAGPTTKGTCRIAVDGSTVASTATGYGQSSLVFDSVDHRASLAINLVSDVLGAGAHAFRTECNDPTGDVSFAGGGFSAVMIGTD